MCIFVSMKNDDFPLRVVFSGNRMEAEILKGALEANGIPSMIKDESLSTVTSPYLMAGGTAKLLVHPDDEEDARSLIG